MRDVLGVVFAGERGAEHEDQPDPDRVFAARNLADRFAMPDEVARKRAYSCVINGLRMTLFLSFLRRCVDFFE